MFRVYLDGVHNQVQFARAVHLAGHAVVLVWRDLDGSGEVVQAVDPARGVTSHEEHDKRAVLRPREQEQMIGAEMNIGGSRSGNQNGSRPIVSAVEGLPGELLRPGMAPQRGACLLPAATRPADSGSCWPYERCHRQKEDLGILYEPVRDRGGNRGVVQDVFPLGEGSVCRNDCGTLVAVAGGDDLVEEVGGLLIHE